MTLVLVLRPRKTPSLRRTEWRKYEHEKERGRNPETDRSILHWGGEKVIIIVWPGNWTSSMLLLTHFIQLIWLRKVVPLSLIFIITRGLLSCPEESEDFLMHKANQLWERVEEDSLWDASNAQRACSSVSPGSCLDTVKCALFHLLLIAFLTSFSDRTIIRLLEWSLLCMLESETLVLFRLTTTICKKHE